MSRLEPKYPYLGVKRLGWMMREWHKNGITDARSAKMLRLWLGSEFTGYMDEKGRISVRYMTEIRKYLGYPNLQEFQADLFRSVAFFLLGQGGELSCFASPVWYEYSEKDSYRLIPGGLMPKERTEERQDGSDAGFRQEFGQKSAVSNINIYNNPTGGNPDGFSLREEGGEKPKDALEIKRDRGEACRVVREYFRWVRQQTDADHQSLVNDLLLRLMEPRDCKGELIESQCLSRDDAQHVLSVLFTQVLPDRLSRQDKFFEAKYMAHPEKRIYWMRNLMKSYAYKHIARARELWLRRKDVVLELHQQELSAQEEQHRPVSPHEWQDAQGQRWYRWQGARLTIPADAPPRPSDAVQWNRIVREWR